jgi:hypothetical protein
MIKATLNFDQRSLSDFSARLNAIRSGSRKAGWKLCNRLALWTAKSGQKAAKLGKRRKRFVVTARNKQERAELFGFKYAIRNYSLTEARWAARWRKAGMTNGWWFTSKPSLRDRLADIMYRGAAKASWAGIQRKLGVVAEILSDVLKTVMLRCSWVNFKRGEVTQSITIYNKLFYMGKIQPTIMGDAVEKAHNRLEGYEKDRIAKEQLAMWGP